MEIKFRIIDNKHNELPDISSIELKPGMVVNTLGPRDSTMSKDEFFSKYKNAGINERNEIAKSMQFLITKNNRDELMAVQIYDADNDRDWIENAPDSVRTYTYLNRVLYPNTLGINYKFGGYILDDIYDSIGYGGNILYNCIIGE